VEKVLRSAVANAESRPDLHWQGDDLVVITAYADEGPTLKRWRARARGRVARIRKRTCHITIELAPVGGGSLPAPRNVPVPEAPAQEPIPVGPEPDEPQAETPEAEVAAEAPAEEKPKRRSRAKKTEETSAEAAPAEEKPKRTRSKKTEEKES
jgi:large subunit ribosomal protein L22